MKLSTIINIFAEAMTIIAEAMTENMATETKEIGDETYNYFMSLGYAEQEDYFKSNKILSMYIDREYYPNSKHYTARGASRIAKIYNREFTNKYNIY